MKGYFSLNYDYPTDEVQFGNLDVELGTLGDLHSIIENDARIASLIAHDVVEHAISHRTKNYVTYEEEMRAIGAIAFVRGSVSFDLYQELLTQLELCGRDVKPVPRSIGKFLHKNGHISTEFIKYLIREGITPNNARNGVYQYAWGEYQKAVQFNMCNYAARSAFAFIERNVIDAIKDLHYQDGTASGVSIFFDTVKQIFRYQFKRTW